MTAIPPPLPEPAASEAERRFACPHCDAIARWRPELAGKQLRCPRCRNIFRCPTVSQAMPGSRHTRNRPRAGRDAVGCPRMGGLRRRLTHLRVPPGSRTSGRTRRRLAAIARCWLIATAVLMLAFALVEVPGGRVAVRGLAGYPLPPSCVPRARWGIHCPGCGLTRSFIHLAEGDWRASWRVTGSAGCLAAA